ncbi:glutaredoxin family protein [Trifolium repens]|nr:glutaredoxin family protein [Trifolium repens]
MGCSVSKNFTIVVKNSEDNSSCSSPKALSLPMPLVHHPATRKGDTHHLVSLTSTTYGSLLMIDKKYSNFNSNDCCDGDSQKLNQTQIEQSLSPDSVINTWELMDGLNDDDDCDENSNFDNSIDSSMKPSLCREKAFDGSFSETLMENNKKPLWQHLSEEALLAKLDPNVVLSYRRALLSRKQGTIDNILANRAASSIEESSSNSNSNSPLGCCSYSNNLHSGEDKIVLYFTSLRGIRKTYEDCCSVRMILKGFRVAVDEKDISMDSSYRKELQNALGDKVVVTLPQVFIRGKHVGNADEIKLLNESGELENLLKDFPVKDSWLVCESCGDARFVPCSNCNGSRKVFEEEEEELIRCIHCNENGLKRCPGCCS